VAVPSKAFRQVTQQIAGFSGILVSVTKGIECDTGLTMSGVAQTNAPTARVAALSGPTLALEVARGIPSAIVAASHDLAAAQTVQQLFHRPAFRVYTSADLLGVELGGALKNVIAIGAGMCDGLGFGDNSKAALITRAIVEIRRVGGLRRTGNVCWPDGPRIDGDLLPPQPESWAGERLGRGRNSLKSCRAR
jgi:glycerol-3-phosphate dehydrogenase (NAD(P)+)